MIGKYIRIGMLSNIPMVGKTTIIAFGHIIVFDPTVEVIVPGFWQEITIQPDLLEIRLAHILACAHCLGPGQ